VIRSLEEARDSVRSDPKRWRACVYEATGTPLTEREDTRVYLYCLVRTAQEKFRERIAALEDAGYVRNKAYRLGSEIAKLERDADSVWLAVDKPKTAKKPKSVAKECTPFDATSYKRLMRHDPASPLAQNL
jgi:hypothetical protein